MQDKTTNDLTDDEISGLIALLKSRFENNMHRHEVLMWQDIEARLIAHPEKLVTLNEMERTGGEPDVVVLNSEGESIIFIDCSKESPTGRRSVCYDREGLASRKKFQPENNAVDMAKEIGIELLTEEEYRALQQLEEFDLKTSSWVRTPEKIRKLGGALFCDRRYDQVFLYHNGASSYYAGRGFRGKYKI